MTLDALSPVVAELEIPGVAIGVLDRGETQTWCAGVTSLDHPLPVTDTTIFQLASISKTFAGTTAMVLVDQGKLDLDIPIVEYVPDLRLSSPELTAQVTLRHIFTHVTGWVGDYFGDTGQGDDALARFVAKLAKAPQLTPLGSTFSYNNSAFNLAAHVIASVAEVPYEGAVKDLVLRPLGMKRTFYGTDDAIGERIAIGHRGGIGQPWRRARAHGGASGVLSCVADLLVYAGFHLGDGSPLMKRSTLASMHRSIRPSGSLGDEIAVVWNIDSYAGRTVLHHGGSSNGYQCDLRFVPELDLAWVLLTNGDHEHQLDRAVMSELLGPDAPMPSFVPAELGVFAGRYEAVLAALEVSVEVDGLTVSVGTPPSAVWNPGEDPPPARRTRLKFRDEDRVEAIDMPFTGHRGEFLREGGEVTWFRWDGRIARRIP